MPDDFASLLKVCEDEAIERWRKTKISVMVFGPNTEGTTPGGQLRRFIIQKCKAHGIAIKGEHKELIDVYRKILGSDRNLCTMELDWANRVNAVVIIPDSAGALVELGMFSFFGRICSKTIVLFKDKYSPDRKLSFINLGPKLAYEEKKAKIEYVNYQEKELVWNKVEEFLLGFRAAKWEQSLLKEMVA